MEVGYQNAIDFISSLYRVPPPGHGRRILLAWYPVACAPHRIASLSPSAHGPQSLTGLLSIYYFFL